MKNIRYLVDEKGTIEAVQLSAKDWAKVEKLVLRVLDENESKLTQKQGPLNDFKTLMEYWDFSYPYSPEVTCPHCGAATEDWRKDSEHIFILTNANLGGLLVFHCSRCGTTIRQKHFKDHISYEHTVPQKKA